MTRTETSTTAEALGADFLKLIQFFRERTYMIEGHLACCGIARRVVELVNLGWLRPVKGPARFDRDWLVPSGHLAQHLAEIKGSAVLAVWANYQERQL